MNIKLRNAVTKRKRVTYTVRPDLWAQKCDYCGKVFRMRAYCNDRTADYEVGPEEAEAATSSAPRPARSGAPTSSSTAVGGR